MYLNISWWPNKLRATGSPETGLWWTSILGRLNDPNPKITFNLSTRPRYRFRPVQTFGAGKTQLSNKTRQLGEKERESESQRERERGQRESKNGYNEKSFVWGSNNNKLEAKPEKEGERAKKDEREKNKKFSLASKFFFVRLLLESIAMLLFPLSLSLYLVLLSLPLSR